MQYTNKKWTTTILKQVPKSSMFSHTESVKISKKVISPFFLKSVLCPMKKNSEYKYFRGPFWQHKMHSICQVLGSL